MLRFVGIVLIILGVVSFATGGFTFTREEKVLDIGPIQATAEKRERIPLPPLLGGAALISGVVLLIAGSRGRK